MSILIVFVYLDTYNVGMKKILSDFSFQSIITGFLVCLIGYASSALIVFEAARKYGLSVAQASSWLGVLCLAMGILTICFSYKYKIPLLFAWSTPGAVILLNSATGISLSAVIGSFLFSAFLMAAFGATGLFEKVMNKIPPSLAHAMLAGVLFKFALNIFTSFSTNFALCFVMFFTFLLAKRFFPKFAVVIVMLVGIIYCYSFNLLNLTTFSFEIIRPVFFKPGFDLVAIIGIGIPLFIVTMTTQNLTGLAVLKSFSYKPPVSRLITISGLVNLVTALFGGFAINLAAITAAICMGPDTHIEHSKRYTSAIISGIFYLFMGIFCTAFGSLFSMFPVEMIAVLTGVALFNTISNSIIHIGQHPIEKDSAMLTFFITASGVVLFGVGSAFWGILVGSLTFALTDKKRGIV